MFRASVLLTVALSLRTQFLLHLDLHCTTAATPTATTAPTIFFASGDESGRDSSASPPSSQVEDASSPAGDTDTLLTGDEFEAPVLFHPSPVGRVHRSSEVNAGQHDEQMHPIFPHSTSHCTRPQEAAPAPSPAHLHVVTPRVASFVQQPMMMPVPIIMPQRLQQFPVPETTTQMGMQNLQSATFSTTGGMTMMMVGMMGAPPSSGASPSSGAIGGPHPPGAISGPPVPIAAAPLPAGPVPEGTIQAQQQPQPLPVGCVHGPSVLLPHPPMPAGVDQQFQLQTHQMQRYMGRSGACNQMYNQNVLQQPHIMGGGAQQEVGQGAGVAGEAAELPMRKPAPPSKEKNLSSTSERRCASERGREQSGFPADDSEWSTLPPPKSESSQPNPTREKQPDSGTRSKKWPRSEMSGACGSGGSKAEADAGNKARRWTSGGSSSTWADSAIPGPASTSCASTTTAGRPVEATLELLPEHFQFLGGGCSPAAPPSSAAKSGAPGRARRPPSARRSQLRALGDATLREWSRRSPDDVDAVPPMEAPNTGMKAKTASPPGAARSSTQETSTDEAAVSSGAAAPFLGPPPKDLPPNTSKLRSISSEDAARIVKNMEDTLAWRMVRLTAETGPRGAFLSLARSEEGSIVLQRKLARLEVGNLLARSAGKEMCQHREYDRMLEEVFGLRALQTQASTRLYLLPDDESVEVRDGAGQQGSTFSGGRGRFWTLPEKGIDIPGNGEARRAVARKNALTSSRSASEYVVESTPLSDAINALSPPSGSAGTAADSEPATQMNCPCAFLRLLLVHLKHSFQHMLGDVHANRVLEVVLERFPAMWLVIAKGLVERRKERIRQLLMQHQQAPAGGAASGPKTRKQTRISSSADKDGDSLEIGVRIVRNRDWEIINAAGVLGGGGKTSSMGYPASEELTNQLIADAGGAPPTSPGGRTLVLYNSLGRLTKEKRRMSWSKVAVRTFARLYWQYGKYVYERNRDGSFPVFRKLPANTVFGDLMEQHRGQIQVLMQELTELYLPDLDFGCSERRFRVFSKRKNEQGMTYLHIYRYLLQEGGGTIDTHPAREDHDECENAPGRKVDGTGLSCSCDKDDVDLDADTHTRDDDAACCQQPAGQQEEGGKRADASTTSTDFATPSCCPTQQWWMETLSHSLHIKASDRRLRKTLVPEPLITAELRRRLEGNFNLSRKFSASPVEDKRFRVDYSRVGSTRDMDPNADDENDKNRYLPQPHWKELTRIFKPLAEVIMRAETKLGLALGSRFCAGAGASCSSHSETAQTQTPTQTGAKLSSEAGLLLGKKRQCTFAPNVPSPSTAAPLPSAPFAGAAAPSSLAGAAAVDANEAAPADDTGTRITHLQRLPWWDERADHTTSAPGSGDENAVMYSELEEAEGAGAVAVGRTKNAHHVDHARVLSELLPLRRTEAGPPNCVTRHPEGQTETRTTVGGRHVPHYSTAKNYSERRQRFMEPLDPAVPFSDDDAEVSAPRPVVLNAERSVMTKAQQKHTYS